MSSNPHQDRADALDRALKMSKLFKLKHFENVMKPIYKWKAGNITEDEAKDKFEKACGVGDNANNIVGAQLDDREIVWLWNYLSHWDEDKTWDAIHAAANPGW